MGGDHLVSLNRVARAKNKGGLGIRRLKERIRPCYLNGYDVSLLSRSIFGRKS